MRRWVVWTVVAGMLGVGLPLLSATAQDGIVPAEDAGTIPDVIPAEQALEPDPAQDEVHQAALVEQAMRAQAPAESQPAAFAAGPLNPAVPPAAQQPAAANPSAQQPAPASAPSTNPTAPSAVGDLLYGFAPIARWESGGEMAGDEDGDGWVTNWQRGYYANGALAIQRDFRRWQAATAFGWLEQHRVRIWDTNGVLRYEYLLDIVTPGTSRWAARHWDAQGRLIGQWSGSY